MNSKSRKAEKALILIILATFILAYLIPTYMMQKPADTDAYTHLVYTKYIVQVESIKDFYILLDEKKSNEALEYSGYFNYPFGLWLYGSLVSKITGVDPLTLSYALPIIFLVITILMFYVYSKNLLNTLNERLLSVGLLLSMPVVSTFLLSYRPSVYTLPLLLMVMHCALRPQEKWKAIVKNMSLAAMASFCICVSHTGTFMFLMLFVLVYLIFYALLWGSFQRNMYILLVLIFATYSASVALFPVIQPQYTLKSTLLLSTGEAVAKYLHLAVISEFTHLFYDEMFVEGSGIYVLIWSTLIFGAISFLVFLRKRVLGIFKKGGHTKPHLAIPFIGSISGVSHSIAAAPFWIGPMHSLLALPGVFRLSRAGKCILATILVVTVLPGSLQSGSTGAIREMYYALIIIPIVSVLGFYWLLDKLRKQTGRLGGSMPTFLLCFSMATCIIIVPMIGNVYFMPISAGMNYEIDSMKWLSTVGSTNEKAIGMGYRQLSTFAQKLIVDAEYGTATRTLIEDLMRVYFYGNSESYARDLHYTYGTQYIASSPRSIENIVYTSGYKGDPTVTVIDANKELDKIQSTVDFSIYSYSDSERDMIEENISTGNGLQFYEPTPAVQNLGASFIVDTDLYKVSLDKKNPIIKYLGDDRSDYLGGGYLQDYLQLAGYGGPYHDKISGYVLNNLNYSVYRPAENQIEYRTILTPPGQNESWASLVVKYTFYSKAFKKEILVANDMLPMSSDSWLRMSITSMQFSPLSSFVYLTPDGKEIRKTVYPSDDQVSLKDASLREIYFTDGSRGLFVKYDSETPYTSRVTYQGSSAINYSSKEIEMESFISPADYSRVTSYISIGNKDTVRNNVLPYTSVSIYPFPSGEKPIVLAGYLGNSNNMPDEEYAMVRDAYVILGDKGANYSEALSAYSDNVINGISGKDILDSGQNLLAYVKLFNNSYGSKEAQRESIQETLDYLNENYGSVQGTMTYDLGYNIDTIKAFEETGQDFLMYMGTNQPGLGTPRKAYYHGNETDVVLLSVTQPTSQSLGYKAADNFASWKYAIDQASVLDGSCIFLWRSKDIGSPQYSGEFENLMDYASNRSMYFTSPEEIALHYKSLSGINAYVTKGVDSVWINVSNKYSAPINGVTFRIALPEINHLCPYAAENAVMKRNEKTGGTCILYVIADLKKDETKLIGVRPTLERISFRAGLTKEPVIGENVFYVLDGNNQPVSGASLTIGNDMYVTDGMGQVKKFLDRGSYSVRIEKPGYETKEYAFSVKGRAYVLQKISAESYGIALLLLVGLFVFLRKRKGASN